MSQLYWIGPLLLVLSAFGLSRMPILRYAAMISRAPIEGTDIEGEEMLPEMTTVVFVAASPGEVEFSTGGTLPKLTARGNRMVLAVLSDGRPSLPIERLRTRAIDAGRAATRKATKVAGFSNTLFYGLPVERLEKDGKAVSMLTTLLKEVKPGAVFAFDPTGSVNRHGVPAVGKLAETAVERAGHPTRLFFYQTERPNLVVDISDTFEGKLRLLAHFDRGFGWKPGFEYVLRKLGRKYGRLLGFEYGEGYLVKPKEG
ncbi:MAG: PIG-L deacetylase family protein [Candidatus Aquicultorales bacterium]